MELVDSLLVPDPAPGSSQYPSNTQEGASFLRTDQWRPLQISRTGAPQERPERRTNVCLDILPQAGRNVFSRGVFFQLCHLRGWGWNQCQQARSYP